MTSVCSMHLEVIILSMSYFGKQSVFVLSLYKLLLYFNDRLNVCALCTYINNKIKHFNYKGECVWHMCIKVCKRIRSWFRL